MIESRCGILCSECEFANSMGCKGCVKIEDPFWGECPVKKSCEGKGHTHCGECGEFPCGLLHKFAYDEKQGDGGKRIEQCKMWAKNGG